MTRYTLMATASAVVVAMAIASPALAGSNNFANKGNGNIIIDNFTFSGPGGDGNDGGDGAGAGVGNNGGVGGAGGRGGNGGVITNNVNANSGNTYNRKRVEVKASNDQYVNTENNEMHVINGNNTIDTSGGYNKQRGGDASAYANADTTAYNYNKSRLNGADANGSSASSTNNANTTAEGGDVEATTNLQLGPFNAEGDASAHATGNGGTQGAEATSGLTRGGDGGAGNDESDGGSTNANETLGGTALAESTGGNTSGPQNANGGAVGSGDGLVDGLGSAAGAYALNGASGAFGVGNAANAVAAHVNTINSF